MLAWFSWWTGHLRICFLHFCPNLCHSSHDLVLGCAPSGGWANATWKMWATAVTLCLCSKAFLIYDWDMELQPVRQFYDVHWLDLEPPILVDDASFPGLHAQLLLLAVWKAGERPGRIYPKMSADDVQKDCTPNVAFLAVDVSMDRALAITPMWIVGDTRLKWHQHTAKTGELFCYCQPFSDRPGQLCTQQKRKYVLHT